MTETSNEWSGITDQLRENIPDWTKKDFVWAGGIAAIGAAALLWLPMFEKPPAERALGPAGPAETVVAETVTVQDATYAYERVKRINSKNKAFLLELARRIR